MDMLELPIKSIFAKENVRGEIKEDVSELIASIKENGLLQPIGVKAAEGDRYQVIFGHRRLEAMRKLGRKTIECLVLKGLERKDALILNILENLQRRDLSAFEYGKMIDVLMTEEKMTQTEVASRLGVALRKVKQYLEIFRMTPQKHRAKVKAVLGGPSGKRGNIPVALAHEIGLLGRISDEDRDELYELAKQDDFTKQHYNILVGLLEDGLSFAKAKKIASSLKSVRLNVVMTAKDYEAISKLGRVGPLLKTLLYGENQINPIKRIR